MVGCGGGGRRVRGEVGWFQMRETGRQVEDGAPHHNGATGKGVGLDRMMLIWLLAC